MVKVLEDKYPAGYDKNKTDGMYLDGNLKANLDVLKKAITDDWDGVVIVDGVEGGGKSVLAQQCAIYCDNNLTLDRIAFRPDSFRKAVLGADKYNAVIFDEAFGGLSSRKTMSETNHVLVSMLTEIRQKNLFIFVVLPTYFDLDRYVALWRSRALIHVYADKFKRGFFTFYSYKKKKEMYVKGKKFYDYKCIKADFYGAFTDFYPIGREQYKDKKRKSLRDYDPEYKREDARDIKTRILKNVARNMYYNSRIKFKKQDIAELLGLTRQTMTTYLRIEEK